MSESDSSEKDSRLVVSSVDQMRDCMLAHDRVVIVGNQSKPPLWRGAARDTQVISTSGLSGVIEYEPSEFTITVWAGTPIFEISEILADQGQYLPFDPVLCFDGGATIGGTVASGLSGPGRFRYGGVRDFILGVQFLDGRGQLINSGGRVVKNAAGFDIPKFLVGSLGRYAAMTQMTFKVFPRAELNQTFQITCDSHQQAAERTSIIARDRWELDALDYECSSKSIFFRLRGDESTNNLLARDIADKLNTDIDPLANEIAEKKWESVNRLRFHGKSSDSDVVCKALTDPKSMVSIADWSDYNDAQVHFSSASAMAWISMKEDSIATSLTSSANDVISNGLIVKGAVDGSSGYLYPEQTSSMVQDVTKVFDPEDRFAR